MSILNGHQEGWSHVTQIFVKGNEKKYQEISEISGFFFTFWSPRLDSELRIKHIMYLDLGFPGSSMVKKLPAMQETQETWLRTLG